VRQVDDEAFLLESLGEDPGGLAVIFDEENSQLRGLIPSAPCARGRPTAAGLGTRLHEPVGAGRGNRTPTGVSPKVFEF